MRQNFILHIGRHKCGTTTLQRFLRKNMEQLRRSGIYYPRSGRDDDGAHHYLARYLQPRENKSSAALQMLKTQYEAFIQEIRDVEIPVLLSSEGFQKVNPLELPEIFDRDNTRIIVYIREQAEYLKASYSEDVHAGRVRRSHQTYEEGFSPNYAEFLKPWEKRFGVENITVRIFGSSDLKSGDITADFMDVLKVDYHAGFSYPEKRSNPSIGGNLLYFKRLMNQSSLSDDELRQMYEVLVNLAAKNEKFRIKPQFSKQFVEKIRAKYQESNEVVRNKYFPEREVLFECAPINDHYYSAKEADIFRDIWEILTFIEKRRGELVHKIVGKLIFEYRTNQEVDEIFNDFSKELDEERAQADHVYSEEKADTARFTKVRSASR